MDIDNGLHLGLGGLVGIVLIGSLLNFPSVAISTFMWAALIGGFLFGAGLLVFDYEF